MSAGSVHTILIIDDDEVVINNIAAFLSQHDFRIVKAACIADGIDHFHSSSPDLVIIDIHLPQEDSFVAIQALFDLAPDLPIIVLAERGDSEDLIKALRLGVSDYLILPLEDQAILEHSIESSLKRSRLIEENSRIRKKLEQSNLQLEARIEGFRQDQQAGRHVQISMLPKPPQDICGYHFNHRVIPSLYLSGDAVDYKPISKHKALFYIADVAGHGSSSAFITVLLRFRIEQVRREYIRSRFSEKFSPATILDLLNKDMLDAGLDKHITLFMGVLNSPDNTLIYSVAGHHHLPFLYKEGAADFIPVSKSSFPVGLVDGAEYFEESLTLTDDFALILFSDGILEFLKMQNMEAKENYLCDLVARSKGDFDLIKSGLELNQSVNVPDDIAVMSVSKS